MRTIITALLLTLLSLTATAQTVIDMRTGNISTKSPSDYKVQNREAWQLREDSIAYNDCVTRAFNFLYADSLQAAQELFERALKLRPDAPENAVVRHNIGRIFMARKQWKDAASLFSEVLTKVSRFDDLREDRATCYIEQGKYALALADYEYLTMVHPEDDHYRLFYALMLSRVGRGLDAIDEIDVLVEKDGSNASFYLARASIYTAVGQKGHARADLDRAVQLGVARDEIQELYDELKE